LALSLAAPPVLAGQPPHEATALEKTTARALFDDGVEAFDKREFSRALGLFRASYVEVANPNARLMAARSLSMLRRNAEAYAEAQRAVVEAEALIEHDAGQREIADAARTEAEKLRLRVSLLRLAGTHRLKKGARVRIAGRTIAKHEWTQPMAVEPGDVMVEISGEAARVVAIPPGAEVTIDVRPRPPAPAPAVPGPDDRQEEGRGAEPGHGDRRVAMIVAGSVGAVGFVTFAIFGGLALSKHDDLEEACGFDGRCPADLADERDSGETYQAVANTALAIGIIGTSVGLGLLTWELVERSNEGVSKGPTFVVGPNSIGLRGTF
jgi:hypothetical protein